MIDPTTGGMMWGMGLIGILVVALVILGVAALVKYLFCGHLRSGAADGGDKDLITCR